MTGWTLRQKVVLVAAVSSTIGFLVAGLVMLRLDVHKTREALREELALVAATVAHDARSALMFEDAESARDSLTPLQTRPDFRRAMIVDAAGRAFASSSGEAWDPALPAPGTMTVTAPVEIGEKRLGSVTIQVGLARLTQRRQAFALGLGIAILIGLMTSLAVALPLYRVVSQPLRDLAGNAERLRRGGGWGPSVPRTSNDELGQLTDAINRLLEDLRRREHALEEAKARAEAEATHAAGQAEEARRATETLRAEMTRRRELQEQLLRSQRMELLGQMAGGVAHDVNNALTVIVGWADMGQSRGFDPKRIDEGLSQILAAANQASKVTHQLLAFARKQTPRPEAIDANETVRQLHRLALPIVGEKIRLVCDLIDETTYVRADPGQVEQVLMNLIVNARDAMEDGGSLTLRTGRGRPPLADVEAFGADPGGQYAVIEVEDTGSGMPEAVRERMFEPFFTTKGVGRGTGLGLSVCYGIVKSHGGVLAVDSKPDRGTIFRLYLPQVVAPQPEVELDAALAIGVEDRQGARILVAEDESALRSLLAATLRQDGHRVEVVCDGHEALDVLGASGANFDLVVSDVRMPHLGGTELERQTRERFPSLPFLLISGYHDEQLHADSDDVRLHFLAKPFRPTELRAEVTRILAGTKVIAPDGSGGARSCRLE